MIISLKRKKSIKLCDFSNLINLLEMKKRPVNLIRNIERLVAPFDFSSFVKDSQVSFKVTDEILYKLQAIENILFTYDTNSTSNSEGD